MQQNEGEKYSEYRRRMIAEGREKGEILTEYQFRTSHLNDTGERERAKEPTDFEEHISRLKNSDVPSRYFLTFEQHDAAEIPSEVRFWEPSNGNLLLHGTGDNSNAAALGTGTGKTFAALWLLQKIKRTSPARYCKFVDLPSLFLQRRSTWGAKARGAETEEDIAERLSRVNYLFLDDLGAEKLTEDGAEFLFAVINRRWAEERRTIITTNLSVRGIVTRYGEKLASRILAGVQVEFRGNDRRILKA